MSLQLLRKADDGKNKVCERGARLHMRSPGDIQVISPIINYNAFLVKSTEETHLVYRQT